MNQKTGKILVTILQVVSLIGLLVVIYFLYRAYTDEKRVVEDNSLMRIFEEHNVLDEGIKINIDKKEFIIKHVGEKTVINDKKIDFYAMKVYLTDKFLILSSVGQYGEVLQFYNTDLNLIYDSGTMQFTELELKDGKIVGNAINSTFMAIDGYTVDALHIVACNEEVTTKISGYNKTISKHEKEIVEGEYIFSYDTELLIEIVNRKTIGDLFNQEIEDETDKYCVVIN